MVELMAFTVGLVLGTVGTLVSMLIAKRMHNARTSSSSSSLLGSFEPGWHSDYLCTPGYKAPYGIVDTNRPISEVWMCGISNRWEQCRGSHVVEGEGLGPEGVCKYIQSDTGACLRAGRMTSVSEIRDGT